MAINESLDQNTDSKTREPMLFSALRKAISVFAFTCFLLLSATSDVLGGQSTTFTLNNINTIGTGTFSSPGAGSYTVNGAGAASGLSGTTDSFTYLNLLTSGNVEMIAKLTTQQNTNNYAVAGLMIRESLTSGSPHVTVSASPLNGINLVSRSTSNGPSSTILGPSNAAPVWLRIARSGSNFAGYYSADGYNWTLVGKRQISMSEKLYVGFAVSSLADPTLSTATFTNSVFMRDVPQRSSNMLLWLRGDSGVTLTGGKVSEWLDQSDFANNATQSTVANRPTLATNAINGLPALNFDPANSQWLLAPAGFSDFSKGLSLFVVTKPTSSSNSRFLDFGNNNASNNIQLTQTSATGYQFNVLTGNSPSSVAGSNLTTNSYQLLEAIHDGTATGTLFRNGLQAEQNTSMTPIPNIVRTGNFLGKAFGAANYFQGQIAEIILFNRALSDLERKSIESYIFYKYNVGSTPSIVPPSISITSGTTTIPAPPAVVFDTPVTVALKGDGLAQIKYTTDGSDPITAGIVYTAPFLLSSTGTVKAVAIDGGVQSTFTTSVIQIDPDVSDVARNNLMLWLKADLGVETDGDGFVSKWTDVSGRGHHATQPVPENQPEWNSSAVNGQPAISFDGSKQWLRLPTGFSNFPDGATMVVIANPVGADNSARFFDLGNGGTVDNIMLYMQSDKIIRYRVYNPGQTTLEYTSAESLLNSYQLFQVTHSGTNASMFRNGSLVANNPVMNAIGNVTRTGNYIGQASSGGSEFDGNIAEILMYDRPLTDAERHGIEAYAFGKYNIASRPTIPAPVLSPGSAYSPTPVEITMSGLSGAEIRYTLDGSTPSAASTLYTVPFTIDETKTVKAIAIKNNWSDSPVSVANIVIDPDSAGISNPNLIVWLRSDNFNSTATGVAVDSWHDVSGFHNDASQSTPASMPTVEKPGANNFPAVSFNGSQFLQFPSGFSDFSQGLSIFVVAKTSTETAGQRFLDLGQSSNRNNIQFYQQSENSFQLSILNGSSPSHATGTGLSLTDYQLFEAIHNGANAATLFINGAQVGQSTTMNSISSGSRDANFLGKSQLGDFFNGQISEVIIYNKAVSLSERLKVEGYLNSKYALAPPTQPVISPSAHVVAPTQPISISSVPGATILYSTDGTDPPTIVYDGPFTLANSAEILATATTPGGSATTTKFVQVDNNVKNLPLGDPSSLALWLKADNGVKKNGSNDVSDWADVSGSGNNATQTVGTSQPNYVSSAVNGLPAVSFNGTSEWLQLPSGMSDFTKGISIFMVVNPTRSSPADDRFIDFGNGATSDNIFFSQHLSTESRLTVCSGSTSSFVNASNSVVPGFQLLEAIHTGKAAAAIFNNGTQKYIGNLLNPINLVRTGNFIGKAFTGSPYFQGSIAEILVFNKSLTEAEKKNVEGYLVGRYALAAPLVIAPAITPPSQVINALSPQAIITAYPGATIRYTTDGSTPTASSALYTEPIPITGELVLKAVAFQGATSSAVTTRFYQISPESAAVIRDGLRTWYKADFGVTLNGSQSVSAWEDMSGNGHQANQSTPSLQPAYYTKSGFPTVRTSYLAGQIIVPSYFDINPGLSDFNTGFTFITVTKPYTSAGAATHSIFYAANGAVQDNLDVKSQFATEKAQLSIRKGTSGPDSIITAGNQFLLNKFQLLSCVQDGTTTGKVFVDRVEKATGNVKSANDVTRLINRLGGTPDASDASYDGEFAEILLYNRGLSDSERASIEAYLTKKYRIVTPDSLSSPTIAPSVTAQSGPLLVAVYGPTGAEIHFTVDGTTPDANSTLYVKPIQITSSTTIKAVAVFRDLISPVATQVYTLDPTLWPSGSGDNSPLHIQLQQPTMAIPQ